MSRHRDVRNMDIYAEMHDDEADYDEEDDLPEQEREQLYDALEQVKEALGSEEQSGLSDDLIKDTLYHYYFNVQDSIHWLLEEQSRRKAAEERKDDKPLPMLPPGAAEPDYTSPHEYTPHNVIELQAMPDVPEDGRSNVPLIRLAQSNPEEYFEYSDSAQSEMYETRLSTITERTEHSDSPLQSAPQLGSESGAAVEDTPPAASATSSTTTDYGQVIARHPVSSFEFEQSSSSAGSRTPTPATLNLPIQSTGFISTMPQSAIESGRQAAEPSLLSRKSRSSVSTATSVSDTSKSASTKTKTKSKLSELASSRASMSSRSSVSYSDDSASIRTYPNLRPSSESVLSLRSNTKSGRSDTKSNTSSTATGDTSMSAEVRRAIQTAMLLEEMDQVGGVNDNDQAVPPELRESSAPASSHAPSNVSAHTKTPSVLSSRASTIRAGPVPAPDVTQASPPSSHRSTPMSPGAGGKQPSKLAMLAQSKAQGPWMPKPKAASPTSPGMQIHSSRTEYFTPIANGPTATTAITTTYQSLSSLAHMDRLTLTSPPVASSGSLPHTSNRPVSSKSSKLALKSRKALEKPSSQPEPELEELDIQADLAMFAPNATRTHNDAIKQQEKALKLAQQKKAAEDSARLQSAPNTPKKAGSKKTGTATPIRSTDAQQLDLAGLNLTDERSSNVDEPPPKITIAREKVLEEAKALLQGDDGKMISLVVIGHVDAGKSTLMGRLLYELGRLDEKTKVANERASSKIGKSSFSWAWNLDGTTEERERGITMDVALQTLSTPHRLITILDAPGHKDFIPNMISGASQADCALLVVDASVGEFEAGFERGGQTREHLLLVRSLGVSQIVIAINKLDQVQWDKDRYEEICELLKPFLVQAGFHPSKTKFVPVGAMQGINLVNRDHADAQELNAWYKGPTLVDLLDVLEPPTRDYTAPFRFPIANVFRGQSSGIAVSGRVCGGLVQVGEKLRVLPGDDTAIVKSIEHKDENVQWAVSGWNVTLYLTAVDPGHVNIGSVLCPPKDLVHLATTFTARIIVFDIQVPITAGASVELFHHSQDVPASVSKLLTTLDRSTGEVIKRFPRVLTKSASAEVQITLRSATMSGLTSRAQPIPLEPFADNKDMGRILIRRGGETIAAGIVTGIVN
ncbi:hypothetical protein ABKN59_000306 [Abortiporus biennis]